VNSVYILLKMKIITNLLNAFEKNYFYIAMVLHLLFIIAFLGIVYINSSYLKTLNIIVQFAVAMYLLIRFHPFREHEMKQYDYRIIFSCALFLLINLGLVEGIKSYLPNLMKIPQITKITKNPNSETM